MSQETPGVVELSNNLAIVKLHEGRVEVYCLTRGSIESLKGQATRRINDAFELLGAKSVQSGAYSGWAPEVKSPLLNLMKQAQQEIFGETPQVIVIHAGLECGLIKVTHPDMEVISFGPTIPPLMGGNLCFFCSATCCRKRLFYMPPPARWPPEALSVTAACYRMK